MPTKTARATTAQRETLIKIRADLAEAYASLPQRFFATNEQRRAYAVVLHHLEVWAGYES